MKRNSLLETNLLNGNRARGWSKRDAIITILESMNILSDIESKRALKNGVGLANQHRIAVSSA